jgi:hypothetical protein
MLSLRIVVALVSLIGASPAIAPFFETNFQLPSAAHSYCSAEFVFQDLLPSGMLRQFDMSPW